MKFKGPEAFAPGLRLSKTGVPLILMQDFKACVGADASVRPMSSREFSQYPVGADAHIGPLRSCGFAEEYRIILKSN